MPVRPADQVMKVLGQRVQVLGYRRLDTFVAILAVTIGEEICKLYDFVFSFAHDVLNDLVLGQQGVRQEVTIFGGQNDSFSRDILECE